jgi:hypothetical protein
MATPPSEPTFDKSKFKDVPWLPKFWEVLLPFIRETVAALAGGSTVQEQLAAAWLDVTLEAGQTFPMSVSNPLRNKQPPHGVLVAAARPFESPDLQLLAASTAALTIAVSVSTDPPTATATGTAALPLLAVGVDWSLASNGDIRLNAVTGLPANKKILLRLLVLAR